MQYDYDMLGNRGPYGQHGSRRALDAQRCRRAAPLYGWDSRDHRLRTELRRAAQAGSRCTCRPADAPEQLVGRMVYGESRPDAEVQQPARQAVPGLRRRRCGHHRGVRLQGQRARVSSRQLAVDYRTTPDWSSPVALEAEIVHHPDEFRRAEPPDHSDHAGRQHHPASLQRGQPARGDRREPARRNGGRAAGVAALRHRHRLRRQGPARRGSRTATASSPPTTTTRSRSG